MGQLVSLKCQKCGYETNLGVGQGKLYCDMDAILTLFDKDTQEKIKDAVAKNPQSMWNAYKAIGVCEKCGKISAISVFETTDASGNMIRFHSKCQCGSVNIELYDVEKVLEGKSTISCPICSDALEVTVNGFWD